MDAQPKIVANLDFDFVAHLGYVKNVDLLTKGIYMVQIKLFYGLNGTTVAPVGMFSSPSTLRSEVQGQTVRLPFFFVDCDHFENLPSRFVHCSCRKHRYAAFVKSTTQVARFVLGLLLSAIKTKNM